MGQKCNTWSSTGLGIVYSLNSSFVQLLHAFGERENITLVTREHFNY